MNKSRLKHLIEENISLERITRGDFFPEVQQLVTEYHARYGDDKWVSDTVCHYLIMRRTTNE